MTRLNMRPGLMLALWIVGINITVWMEKWLRRRGTPPLGNAAISGGTVMMALFALFLLARALRPSWFVPADQIANRRARWLGNGVRFSILVGVTFGLIALVMSGIVDPWLSG